MLLSNFMNLSGYNTTQRKWLGASIRLWYIYRLVLGFCLSIGTYIVHPRNPYIESLPTLWYLREVLGVCSADHILNLRCIKAWLNFIHHRQEYGLGCIIDLQKVVVVVAKFSASFCHQEYWSSSVLVTSWYLRWKLRRNSLHPYLSCVSALKPSFSYYCFWSWL